MSFEPAPYPDIDIYPGDVPISWRVTMKREGQPLDVTNSILSAPVTDNGVEVAQLTIEKTGAVNGEVRLTITQEVYDAVQRYSTWRLREDSLLRAAIVQGRLVKRI